MMSITASAVQQARDPRFEGRLKVQSQDFEQLQAHAQAAFKDMGVDIAAISREQYMLWEMTESDFRKQPGKTTTLASHVQELFETGKLLFQTWRSGEPVSQFIAAIRYPSPQRAQEHIKLFAEPGAKWANEKFQDQKLLGFRLSRTTAPYNPAFPTQGISLMTIKREKS